MKKLRLLMILSAFAITANAQIPNPSFESWYSYSLGEYPTGWTTSDSVAAALGGGNNAYKDTDAFDGSYALHLKSVHASFVNGPGVATNGKVALVGANFVFSGGTADTTRARFLTGNYKYSPKSANDQGKISCLMSKDSAGIQDTVAYGECIFQDTVTSYQPFFCVMYFKRTDINPDTFLIIIQSSRAINDPDLGIGTELVIDSLNFSGWVGIEDANNVINAVNIYPSPAQNHLTVDVDLKRKIELNCSIYDLNGKKVFSMPFKSDKETIDISDLAKGNYILKMNDVNGKSIYSKNFIKQ